MEQNQTVINEELCLEVWGGRKLGSVARNVSGGVGAA